MVSHMNFQTQVHCIMEFVVLKHKHLTLHIYSSFSMHGEFPLYALLQEKQ